MTSTPVKGVGALMNFVGERTLTQTGTAEPASSFGDVMSKTQNDAVKSRTGQQSEAKSKKVAAKDAYESRRDAVKDTNAAQKPDTAKNVKAQQTEAVEETGKELVKDIAGKLGVPEEDVEKAMEELGMTLYSLFDPASLTQLVLNLSDNADVSALLTDEGLFATLQELLQLSSEAAEELLAKLDAEPDELQSVLEKLQRMAENGSETDAAEGAENEPEIIVEVHNGDETVKLAADENGNAIKTLEAVSEKESSADAKEEAGAQEKDSSGEKEHTSSSEAAMVNSETRNGAQVQQTEGMQNEPFFNTQTKEIMDQIMDHMKIQLKPGMEQLQLQLHPESLGTVHIQLTNKGGEITAQFHVQNETVKAAIESQVAELRESLREQGVKVEAVEVTVESHGFESNLWQGQESRKEDNASQNDKRAPRRMNLNELDALFEEQASEEELLNARVMEMNGNTVDYTA